MSDLRAALDLQWRMGQTEVKEVPSIYLPPTLLRFSPVALAASPADYAFTVQPWPCYLLANYLSVFVNTTNNGTNYWTIEVLDVPGTVLANPNTAAIAANTWERLNPTVGAQPASTSARFYYRLTATGSPGSIYVVPVLSVLRTG